MTTVINVQLQCPGCKQCYADSLLSSYYGARARIWSDGYGTWAFGVPMLSCVIARAVMVLPVLSA